MSKKGITINPGYRSGSHWAICDLDGRQYRAEELIETWSGLWVNEDDFEPRHPQDSLRVRQQRFFVTAAIRPADVTNVIDPTWAFYANNESAAVGRLVVGIGKVGRDYDPDLQLPSGTFNNAI